MAVDILSGNWNNTVLKYRAKRKNHIRTIKMTKVR